MIIFYRNFLHFRKECICFVLSLFLFSFFIYFSVFLSFSLSLFLFLSFILSFFISFFLCFFLSFFIYFFISLFFLSFFFCFLFFFISFFFLSFSLTYFLSFFPPFFLSSFLSCFNFYLEVGFCSARAQSATEPISGYRDRKLFFISYAEMCAYKFPGYIVTLGLATCREEIRRWHPDKFAQKFADRLKKEYVQKVFCFNRSLRILFHFFRFHPKGIFPGIFKVF